MAVRTQPFARYEALSTAVQRLSRLTASRRAAAKVAAVAGVDVSQQGIQLLRALHRSGRQPIAALAAGAQMDVGAVSREVRVLVDRGLVERATDAGDARVVLVSTTPGGRRLAQRLHDVGLAHVAAATAGWPAADVARLSTLLDRFVEDLLATDIPAP